MVATGTYIYGKKGKEIKAESVEGTKEGYAKGPTATDTLNANNGNDVEKKGAMDSKEPIGKVAGGDIEMGA